MILSYNVTHRLALNKHSLKDDYSFQLDIGHHDQINARSKMCFDDQ